MEGNNNVVVQIIVGMTALDGERIFTIVKRRRDSKTYQPSDASTSRLADLVRAGKVSYYPVIKPHAVYLIMGRKGY